MPCVPFTANAVNLGKLKHGCLSRNQASKPRLAGIRCEAPHVNGNKPLEHAASTSGRSRSSNWERKSDVYVLRSDGHSCNRETVTGEKTR